MHLILLVELAMPSAAVRAETALRTGSFCFSFLLLMGELFRTTWFCFCADLFRYCGTRSVAFSFALMFPQCVSTHHIRLDGATLAWITFYSKCETQDVALSYYPLPVSCLSWVVVLSHARTPVAVPCRDQVHRVALAIGRLGD